MAATTKSQAPHTTRASRASKTKATTPPTASSNSKSQATTLSATAATTRPRRDKPKKQLTKISEDNEEETEKEDEHEENEQEKDERLYGPWKDKEMHLHYSRHYELHCQGDLNLAPEEDQCHWCQIRKFSTHKRAPIYIINKVDNSTLPKNFRFIQASIELQGVILADVDFHAGCECEDENQCKRDGCSCLEDMIPLEGSDLNKKLYVYHSHGSKKGLLRSASIHSRDAIYECHDACQCSTECPNRVVGRGRTIPLQIFRTSDNRGWGVRSTVDIKRGQFVDKYIGEIMTAYQANYRRNKSQLAQRKDVYLFALDKFSDKNSPDERLRGPPLEVDGEYMSGPTRFINHSCEPNLRIFARVGEHSNKHVHDLAFFAIEDISAGTELTFDYVDGNEDDTQDDIKDARKRKDMTRCLCGSRNCRGYLW